MTQCVSRIDSFENDLTRRKSSWKKLVRVVAWLKRLKRDENQKPPNLTADELLHAKLCLFWLAQNELRKPEKQSIRQKLNLEMSDDNLGVLRIHGRLDNFHGDEPILRPVALPSKSKLVRMYAEHVHQSLGHQGYRVVIVNFRKNGVYIIRGKQLLKSIAAKCIKCRIMRRELLTQQMGQLPSFRFKAYCPPFTSVAMDFFGPVKIKKTRNIAISGCVLVIACNTTRIIYLEITETQSTDDFLLAWRRFVTKRGIHPLHVYTDQGETFVGAQKYIKEWLSRWDRVAIHDQLATQGTAIRFSWDFNTPLASHMNGAVESLIRSCRKAFLTRHQIISDTHTLILRGKLL